MEGILKVDDENDQKENDDSDDDDDDDRARTTRSLKPLKCELLNPETDW